MLSNFELFRQFSGIISGIYRYIHKLERDEMVKLGYKGSYAQYLLCVSRFENGITAAQISEICDVDKAAVSRVLSEMQSKGLIARNEKGNKNYNSKVTLTPEGKKASDFVCKRAAAAVEATGNQMSDEERNSFYSTLSFIESKLEFMSKEGIPTK